MLIWLVFDSSHDQGLGHISRLIAFGQLLVSKGIEYCFHVENPIPKNAIDFIQRNKLAAGCTCSGKPSLIFADTYNKRIIEKFTKLGLPPLLVFADEFTPTFGAKVVIEVSPISARKNYSLGTQVLKFQNSPLLRDEIVTYGAAAKAFDGKRKNWIVTLGGVGDQVYKNFLFALQTALYRKELSITVASDSTAVGEQAQALGFQSLNRALDVSAICDNFEGAITGAGVTAWELAYLRHPGFVVGVASNQDFQLEYLVEHKIRFGVQLTDRELQSKLEVLLDMNQDNYKITHPTDGRARVYKFMLDLL